MLPLESPRPSSFILSLPKAELHLHLEGTIDPATLLELQKKHGKESTLTEVEQLYQYKDFAGFLMAFKAITEDLQTPAIGHNIPDANFSVGHDLFARSLGHRAQ